MSKNVKGIILKHSKEVVNGLPKLPSKDVLMEGELAINYAGGKEVLSTKNESGTVVTFSSDDYYTKKKLGIGFTGENSAKTVTDVIGSVSGKTLTQITSNNSSIEVSTAATTDGTVKANIQTNASKISGLTAVSDSDEGAAKISGVTSTDSVKKGIENLYKSLASEIAARKAALRARTIASANKGITVTETPNGDGFDTSIKLTLDEITNGTGAEKTGNDNALTITNNGLFLSTDWTCGEF